jgi:kynurenine formamidase
VTPYDELPVLADGRRHAWHEFAGDERGSLSRVTSEVVRVATAEVGTGERIALSVPLGTFQPALSGNRSDLRHTVTRNRNGGDDKLDNFYLQESSQWDGFAHIRYREFGFFGGREVDDLNAGAIGIDRMAPTGIITRGVLVDVPRHWAATGRTWSPTETIAITPADVDATLAAQGTAVRDGDVLLVRTGWVGWYLGLGEPARKELGGALAVAGLPTPGLCQGEAFPRWLWNHGVAAVAADNPALEAIPVPKGSGFLHRYLLPLLGIPIGELWALDGLAAACERYERWSFLLVSVPLNLPQGVGSPSNAVAVL